MVSLNPLRLLKSYTRWLDRATGDDTFVGNFYGFALSYILYHRLDVAPLATLPYQEQSELKKCGSMAHHTFLPDTLARVGQRPMTTKYLAPCVQLTDLDCNQGGGMQPLLVQELYRIAQEYRTITETTYEYLGGQDTATALVKSIHIHRNIGIIHQVAQEAQREIIRLHQGHLSVVLSPQDCIKVIQQGWGERMPLAGRDVPEYWGRNGFPSSRVRRHVPQESLFIYKPRGFLQVQVVVSIVEAAIRFMTADICADQQSRSSLSGTSQVQDRQTVWDPWQNGMLEGITAWSQDSGTVAQGQSAQDNVLDTNERNEAGHDPGAELPQSTSPDAASEESCPKYEELDAIQGEDLEK